MVTEAELKAVEAEAERVTRQPVKKSPPGQSNADQERLMVEILARFEESSTSTLADMSELVFQLRNWSDDRAEKSTSERDRFHAECATTRKSLDDDRHRLELDRQKWKDRSLLRLMQLGAAGLVVIFITLLTTFLYYQKAQSYKAEHETAQAESLFGATLIENNEGVQFILFDEDVTTGNCGSPDNCMIINPESKSDE